MYFLYKKETPFNIDNSIIIDDKLSVRVIKPQLNSLHSLLWTLLSFGKLKEYQIVNENNEIVSSSQVMPKIFYLSFMDKNSIHIGPCYTIDKYRGKGLYPYLLMEIMKDNLDKNIYIFTEKDNISSQNGIEKAGFIKFADGYKSKLHIYKVLNK